MSYEIQFVLTSHLINVINAINANICYKAFLQVLTGSFTSQNGCGLVICYYMIIINQKYFQVHIFSNILTNKILPMSKYLG